MSAHPTKISKAGGHQGSVASKWRSGMKWRRRRVKMKDVANRTDFGSIKNNGINGVNNEDNHMKGENIGRRQ